MEKRVVLIGLGRRGRQWFHELAGGGWNVVAGVDPYEPARAAAVSEWGLETFAETHEALAATGCDAVMVASAADRHVEPCLAALEAGMPVLVEKPLATSLKEGQAMVDAAAAAGVTLMVAQNYRYMRAHRTVKRVLSEGAVGRVGYVRADYYRSPHDMAPSLTASEHNALWGVAVHHLDALRYVLGAEAEAVRAREYTLPWTDLPPGASLRVQLEFEGGIEVDYGATYESRGHEYFGGGQEFYERITGDRATLHVFHRWLFLCEGRKLPRPVRRGKRAVTEEQILLGEFEDAIVTGAEPECSGRDNLGTMAIIEAVLRSAESGGWVYPKELLGG